MSNSLRGHGTARLDLHHPTYVFPRAYVPYHDANPNTHLHLFLRAYVPFVSGLRRPDRTTAPTLGLLWSLPSPRPNHLSRFRSPLRHPSNASLGSLILTIGAALFILVRHVARCATGSHGHGSLLTQDLVSSKAPTI
jgi:hypothetical protein